MGHITFGYFAGADTFSQISIDNVIRNRIISSLNNALIDTKDGILMLDNFVKKFIRDPFSESIFSSK